MWIRKPFFEYATAALLIVIIIFFLGKIDYFFWPFKVMIGTVFAPLLLAGLFYYLLRPIVSLLSRRAPKRIAILSVFIVIATIFLILGYSFGPVVKKQVMEIGELAPGLIEEATETSEEVVADVEVIGLSGEELRNRYANFVETTSSQIVENVGQVIGVLINTTVVLIVTPFILFFLLKDDEHLRPKLTRYLPEEHKAEGDKVLKDMDRALSDYIVGQVIVAVVIGVLMYIGYLIIGLDYALSLAIFAMFLVIVPFLGPLIGILPALFVALMSGSLFMAVKVLLVLGVVQQLEGTLITPNIMGNRLDIHPLTIILLLLIAASLAGFIGILIAIPVYAVAKTLIHNFRLFMRLRRKREVASHHKA